MILQSGEMAQFREVVQHPAILRAGKGVLLMFLLLLPQVLVERTPFPLFILAGQSNASGFGVKGVSMQAKLESERRLWLWYLQGDPRWPLTASRWVVLGGEVHRGLPSVGAELTLGTRLASLLHSDLGIIKVAFDGTSLGQSPGADWNVSSNELFGQLLGQVAMAMDALPSHLEPVLCGFFWMQGESDAVAGNGQPALAEGYGKNLRDLVIALRQALARPGLPVIIARISPPAVDRRGRRFPFRGQVRRGQTEVAQALEQMAVIDTRGLPRQADDLHFTAEAQQQLGLRFARAWWRLRHDEGASPGPVPATGSPAAGG